MLVMTAAIRWTNLDNCMPRGSKDCEVNQLLCGKEFHEKMRDLKGKFSLGPILLIITIFPKFMLEMHKDMYCMHRILHDW